MSNIRIETQQRFSAIVDALLDEPNVTGSKADWLASAREAMHYPTPGKLLLRMPPEVHGAALVAAQTAGKSLNQWATFDKPGTARSLVLTFPKDFNDQGRTF